MIIALPLRARKRGLAGMGLLLAVTLWGTAWAADPNGENQAALDAVKARISAVEQRLDRDRVQKDEARRELERTERRYVAVSREVRELKRQVEAQRAQQSKAAEEHRKAVENMARQRNVLGKQIRAGYVIGQNGKAKLLLSQDDTQQLSRVLTYYEYLNRARVDRLKWVQEQVEALAAVALRLREATETLERSRQLQEEKLAAQKAVRDERQVLLRKLDSRIANRQEELARLRSEEQSLQQLLSDIQEALADIPADLGSQPFAQLRGKMLWPATGKLMAEFGQPKVGGTLKWNGLWISGKEGDPVRAIASGRVAYVGWMHRYGLIAVVEHDGGYYSLYGHAQAVAVSIGDWVQPGDTIAAVGNTGGHQQPGLYFELRKGTRPINPDGWLTKKQG